MAQTSHVVEALRSGRQRSYELKIPVGGALQTTRVDKVVPPLPPVKASASGKGKLCGR